ncbi:ATP-binding protein [Thiotrichales bacterium 19S9-12]|nr:ATP-binding protein [Thiotrichales bacterium 19S9-11]MCF6811307.1 ATP-binding protein [Thiotrichales bacterium 19S9-12]
MISRKLAPIVIELLKEFRIVYLTGPRQSGKTTLAKTIPLESAFEYISFDNQNILTSAQSDPIGFLASFKNKKLILDEFQYIPELTSAIKQVSDNLNANEKGKFLLTGSADIFRSGKTQEALPGHMARLELYPLSLSEKFNTHTNIIDLLCNQDFNINLSDGTTHKQLADIILQGGYPEVQTMNYRAKQTWYHSYVEGRLYKDFESLYAARGDYRSRLKALIPYLAGLSGNLIKYASISNDLKLEDKVVKSYIEILDLMFIIKVVPAYIRNKAKRQAITMPKLHMIDTGLACSLLGIRKQEQLTNSSYFGGLLENLIYMELMKQNTWSHEKVELFHFRDKYKNEADIVLEKDTNEIIGIEIKASATIKQQDFKGLLKLAEYNPSKFLYGVLFYSGKDILPFSRNGIQLYALPFSLLFK